MGTTIKNTVPDRIKPSFVGFDTWALWCSRLSIRVPGCQKLQPVWQTMLYSCTHMATVGSSINTDSTVSHSHLANGEILFTEVHYSLVF